MRIRSVSEVRREVAVLEKAALAIVSALHDVHGELGYDETRRSRHKAENGERGRVVDR
jgi:hypothetical protein